MPNAFAAFIFQPLSNCVLDLAPTIIGREDLDHELLMGRCQLDVGRAQRADHAADRAGVLAHVPQLDGTPQLPGDVGGDGVHVVASSPEQFASRIKLELAQWSKVVKASGARAD